MGFNDIGSELADPSAIATPLRPAEMFKVKSHAVLDEILSEKKVRESSYCDDAAWP